MKYIYMRFPEFRLKALTLSYDDGIKHDKRLIEILDKYGIKATFNINSGNLGTTPEYLTKEEAIELYTNSGHEVAVHGKRHLHLTEEANAVVLDEIINDRIAIEEMFGTITTGMAYAGGFYDDRVVELLKDCGIDYARTVVSTERFDIPDDWLRLPATCHHNNPRLMELAREFAESEPDKRFWHRPPKLFYLWGHSYEFNSDNNWEVIERFCEYMGNRGDIWYATNIEIFKYVKAFKSLVFFADGSGVCNPSGQDLYICYRGVDYVIPSGQTIRFLKNN